MPTRCSNSCFDCPGPRSFGKRLDRRRWERPGPAAQASCWERSRLDLGFPLGSQQVRVLQRHKVTLPPFCVKKGTECPNRQCFPREPQLALSLLTLCTTSPSLVPCLHLLQEYSRASGHGGCTWPGPAPAWAHMAPDHYISMRCQEMTEVAPGCPPCRAAPTPAVNPSSLQSQGLMVGTHVPHRLPGLTSAHHTWHRPGTE